MLTGGPGTGKFHLPVRIAQASIRSGRRRRFFNVVDLVNKLDAEARDERQGRIEDLIFRPDFLILDELSTVRPNRRPAAVPLDQQAL